MADVRFLESLRIMDYSLFLIVLEMPAFAVPQQPNAASMHTDNPSTCSAEDIKISCEGIDMAQQREHSEGTAKYTAISMEDPERR